MKKLQLTFAYRTDYCVTVDVADDFDEGDELALRELVFNGELDCGENETDGELMHVDGEVIP